MSVNASAGPERWELFRVAVGARTEWLVLRVTGEDGTRGHGECSDAGSLPRVVERLASGLPVDGEGGFLSRTVAGGVEQARVDAAARRDGLPLWDWLGGEHPGEIELYANINRVPGGRSPDDVAACAWAAVRDGFRAVKLAPFDVADPRAEIPLPALGLARLGAARAAVGASVALMADAHERLTLDELAPLLGPLADLGLYWLEDGVGIARPDELAELRSLTELTLAGGEFASDVGEVEKVDGLVDVLMPDVKHAGGTLRARDLARSAPGTRISFHNPSGPVATLHAAHLTGVCGGSVEPLEYAYGEASWRSAVVRGAERIGEGRLTLPDDTPGIGLDLDTDHPAVTRVWSGRLEPHPSCRG
ncbi:enolase C-terminal domain-like protein [Streptomyces sp. NPDC041068]|uniref:enolase C-terminal domain-like protein n=1 Tax=Streptomyces sp. NPDC041068 TaxID=3155130 RepID=UPI0033FD05BC